MKKKKWLKRCLIALGITTLLLVPVIATRALAFDNYYVMEDNSFRIEITQSKASSTATVKYATVGWYLFPQPIEAVGSDQINTFYYPDYSGKINASFYSNAGFPLSTGVSNRVEREETSAYYYDTFEWSAETMMAAMQKWIKAGQLDRDQLKNGVTFYASRPLKILKNGNEIGRVYSYPEMEDFAEKNHINWGGSWNTFRSFCYDQEIHVSFKNTGFSIDYKFVDKDGKPISDPPNHGGASGFTESDVYYGETISVTSPDEISDYKYKGWELSASNLSKKGSGATVNYTANYDDILDGGLVLTFIYEKVEVEMPFSSPTPEPTRAPGATATPTPTPTVTPTPAPPTPTSQPTVNKDYMDSEEWYFSTDQGYYMEQVAGSTTYKIATEASGTAGGSVAEATYTSRDNYYQEGYDRNGNYWYFIPNGSDATYVHPKKYNGYVVDSANVKYITELVFPDTVYVYSSATINGVWTETETPYTVRSIGGGTSKFKTADKSSSYGGSSSISYNYGTESGSYYWSYWQESTSQYISHNREISYKYGVIGNGEIKSDGSQSFSYLNAGTYTWRGYYRYYYVYNTTLKKVVIPSTVTSILPYAFQYCQALETIEGGENLQTIGTRAFEAIVEPKVRLSNEYKYSSSSAVMDIRDYYYYNTSYSKTDYTDIMLAWREASYLCDEMIFPYLPKLKTINYAAFSGHYNIDEVDLSATVSKIDNYAFGGCKLDRIRIPNASCEIYNGSFSAEQNNATLGTKGYDLSGNTTEIHCAPDSTAMNYGLMHDGYYVLYCGHPVSYHPNSAPGTVQTVYSALNINYLETGSYYEYAYYKQSWSDQYSYSSNVGQYQYAIYLDEEGYLWKLDKESRKAAKISETTTFTEVISAGAAYYAWDSSGNLWFTGQRASKSTYTDSFDSESWYTYYTNIVDWVKVSIPSGASHISFDAYGVYYLNSAGAIYKTYPDSGYTLRMSADGQVFTAFSVMTYTSYDSYERSMYLAAVDTAGTLWWVNTYDYSGGSTSVSDWKASTTYTNKAKDVTFGVSRGTNGYQHFVTMYIVGTDGNLYAQEWSAGSWSSSTSTLYSGGDMAKAEYAGSYMLTLTKTSGAKYLAYIYTSYPTPRMSGMAQMTYSASEKVKGIFTGFYRCGDGWATDDFDSTIATECTYIWRADGSVTALFCNEYSSFTVYSPVSVKFKVLEKLGYGIYGIAEDGTLWSAGENQEGELGHSGSYNYEYPSTSTVRYLQQTSTRTYSELVKHGGNYMIARGTDGVLYFTGNSGGCDFMDDNGNYYNFVRLSNQNYTVTPFPGVYEHIDRFIMGYDYDTILAGNPFIYPTYEFKGWNTAANGSGTTYFPGDALELTSAITLYAQWGKSNNIIRYDRNGGSGSMSNTILDYDTTTTTLSPNRFARDGYEFVGWNTYANGTGTAYADGASITVGKGTTTTLYAQWREIVTNYSLIYMKYPYGTAGNTAWKSKTLSYKAVETVEGQPYTPSGSYTVTYNLNKPAGMSTVPAALDKTTDSTPPPVFSKWRLYTKNTAGEYVYGGRQYAQGDTLTQLTKENGGVVYLYPSWQSIGSYVILPYTEADGYIFEGWNEASDGSGGLYPVYPPEDAENIGTYTPVKSTTLYGTWEPLNKNLILDATNTAAAAAGMSATVTNPQTSVEVTFDAVAPDVLAPSCSRWVFMGYYTKLDAAGNPTADSVKVYDTNRGADGTYATYTKGVIAMNNVNGTFNTVTTLYAYWVPDKAVSYEPNYSPLDSTCPSMETTWVDFDKDYVDLPANKFTRSGYVFTGWNTKADGSGTSYKDCERIIGITGRITLYAQWKKNLKEAEVSIFSIDSTYIVRANLKENPELPTFEWREFGDTMLEISVTTIGYFEYAILKAPWETQERVFYWEDGNYSEEEDTWIKSENIVFWRSQMAYPEEEDNVRSYPGYNDQTYTITVEFYNNDELAKEYKVGLWMVSWDTWGDFIHPSRSEGRWDFNGDGIWDLYPFYQGNN